MTAGGGRQKTKYIAPVERGGPLDPKIRRQQKGVVLLHYYITTTMQANDFNKEVI